ncbi:MAG: hypothetical protein RIM99_17090 [Cyclobacteriaceae bacterium]
MKSVDLDILRLQLSIEAKNGLDFVIAATITWSGISFIWLQEISSYNKSVLTFIAGGVMLPLALLLSKFLKTKWKLAHNPLQPLGLWLNVAQLFYFPFLIFALIKYPDYFLMTYVIITGAHLFPFAWFYKEPAYAIIAGIISFGALIITLNEAPNESYMPAFFISTCLLLLGLWLFISYKRKVIPVQ